MPPPPMRVRARPRARAPRPEMLRLSVSTSSRLLLGERADALGRCGSDDVVARSVNMVHNIGPGLGTGTKRALEIVQSPAAHTPPLPTRGTRGELGVRCASVSIATRLTQQEAT